MFCFTEQVDRNPWLSVHPESEEKYLTDSGHRSRHLKTRLWTWTVTAVLLLSVVLMSGCENKEHPMLKVPFNDNFDRKTLGKLWASEMIGRWRIEYNNKTKNGRLCVEQTRNNPLFLLRRLPRDVVVEVDVWAHDRIGDVKVEMFTDGKFHATGYVLVHGGWKNTLSIIDRLDEHNRNCKYNEMSKEITCRRWKRGGPVQNRKYHWKIVRTGKKLSWYIDGKPFMSYNDPDPLAGKAHGYFAFSNWVSRGCFDNLSIRKYTAPVAAAPAVTPRTPAARPVKRIPKPVIQQAVIQDKQDDTSNNDPQDDPVAQVAPRPAPRPRPTLRKNTHTVLRLKRPIYTIPSMRMPTLKLRGKFQNRVFTIRPKTRRR